MKIKVPSLKNTPGKTYAYHEYNNALTHVDLAIKTAQSAATPSGYTDLLKEPRSNVKQKKSAKAVPFGQRQPPTLEQLQDLKQPFSYEWVILEDSDVDKTTGKLTAATKSQLKNLHLSDDEITSLNLVHNLKQECAALIANPYITKTEKKFVTDLKKCLLPNNQNRSIQTMLQKVQETLHTPPPKASWTNPFANFWDKIMRCFGWLEKTKLQQLQTAESIQKTDFFSHFKAAFAKNRPKIDTEMCFINEFQKTLEQKNEPDTAVQKIEIFNAADGKQYNLAELASNKDFVDKNGNLISNKKRDASRPYVSHQQVQKEYQRYQFQKELSAIQASLNSRFDTAFDKCTDLEKFKIHALISTIDAKSRNQFPAPLPSRLWEAQTLDEHKKILRSQEPSTYSTKVQAYLKKMALKIIEKVREPSSAEVKQSQPPSG